MTPRRRAYVNALRSIGLGTVVAVSIMVVEISSAPEDVTYQPSPVEDRVASLVAANDCRVEGLGPDVIPGHAIADIGAGPELVTFDQGWAIYEGTATGVLYAICP